MVGPHAHAWGLHTVSMGSSGELALEGGRCVRIRGRASEMVDAGGSRTRGRASEMVDAGGARTRGRASEVVDADNVDLHSHF